MMKIYQMVKVMMNPIMMNLVMAKLQNQWEEKTILVIT